MKLNKEQRIGLKQYALDIALSYNEIQPAPSGKYEGGCQPVAITTTDLIVKADTIYFWLTEE